MDFLKIVRKDGFLARFLEYCAPYEFPDSYAVFSLLACTSVAIDRRIRVNPGNTPSPWPALYVILYGPSGTKKGGAIMQATRLLSESGLDLTRYADDFTMEALLARLARDSKEDGPGARGIVVNEEFADLIGGADYALRSTAMMAKLWDCRSCTSRETIARKLELIYDPYIVILGATSPEWLEEIDPKVLAGGFLRRLLLVVEFAPKKHAARQKRDSNLFAHLVGEFQHNLSAGAFGLKTAMKLTPEAGEAMEKWYDRLPEQAWVRSDPKARHFASTMQEHVLRVASVVQILEGGSAKELTAESFETGRALVEGLVPGTLKAYRSLVPTAMARLKALAVRTVGEAKGAAIWPGDLDRAIMRAGGTTEEVAMKVRATVLAEGSVRTREDGRIVTVEEGQE